MASKHNFLEATATRRSTVTLKKESPIPDSRIVEIIQHAIKHAPSPFHVQSSRAVILLHGEHDKLWGMTYDQNKKATPPEIFQFLEPNLKAYRASYGTVLFFEDPNASLSLPPRLQNLVKTFPEWSDHSQGMNQFVAWTALCSEGLGCNLQHYQTTPAGMQEHWIQEFGLPLGWVCKAQLVFGTPDGPPRGGVEKTFADLESRVKVFGA